jgi:hypothetical protein
LPLIVLKGDLRETVTLDRQRRTPTKGRIQNTPKREKEISNFRSHVADKIGCETNQRTGRVPCAAVAALQGACFLRQRIRSWNSSPQKGAGLFGASNKISPTPIGAMETLPQPQSPCASLRPKNPTPVFPNSGNRFSRSSHKPRDSINAR